jgi:hypothetical protein
MNMLDRHERSYPVIILSASGSGFLHVDALSTPIAGGNFIYYCLPKIIKTMFAFVSAAPKYETFVLA